MKKLATIATVALASSLALAVAQERTKDKKPASFETLHTAVKTHHDAGRIGAAFRAAKEVVSHLAVKRGEVIRAALPDAPAGYRREGKKADGNQANPFMGAMAASVGNIIEQEYKKEGGGQSIRVTVTADSPMLGFATMMFDNPAMVGPDAEVIKYDDCKAILKKEGSRWSLQILVDSTMVEANLGSESDEFALQMFNQAAVTRLVTAISG